MLSKKKIKQVYLDYAAGTPLDLAVFDVMKTLLMENFSNPSALYASAVEARKVIDKARHLIAELLATTDDTIIFTSGGTEANNLAILGVARINQKYGKHIITTGVEHDSVLGPIHALERDGFEVSYVPVDKTGQICVADVQKAFRHDTILVSIMYANNEIGTVLPIADIGRMILKWRKKQRSQFPFFHTDACQVVQALPIHVEALHVDLLSLNAAKISGPKGIGLLYKRRGIEIEPLLYGGGQEFGLRSGTEATAQIVGMSLALKKSIEQKEESIIRMTQLRDLLWKGIQKSISDIVLNGPEKEMRLPNNLNVSFLGAEAESVVLYLDAAGISVSTGAACATDTDKPSHVLSACHLSKRRLESAVRFTLGSQTSKGEIEFVLNKLPSIVTQVREMGKKSTV